MDPTGKTSRVKRHSNDDYKAMVRALRHFDDVDPESGEIVRRIKLTDAFDAKRGFNLSKVKSWSKSQKRKVREYFEDMKNATVYGYVQPYKPRLKEHLDIAKEYSGQNIKLKEFKVAFIPTLEKKQKITFRKSKMEIASERYVVKYVPLNLRFLVTDPNKEIISKLKKYAPKANAFTLMAGKYELFGGEYATVDGEEQIIENVKDLMRRYSAPDKNNYWGNWLHGIKGYHFKDKELGADYFYEKQVQINRIKENRQKKRAKIAKIRNRMQDYLFLFGRKTYDQIKNKFSRTLTDDINEALELSIKNKRIEKRSVKGKVLYSVINYF